MYRIGFSLFLGLFVVMAIALLLMSIALSSIVGKNPLLFGFNLESMGYLLIGVLFFLGFYYFNKECKKADAKMYKIEREPISPAGYCTTEVPVQLLGKIKANSELLVSPYTKTPCVFYQYLHQREVGYGKTRHLETIEKSSKYIDFSVIDDTGEVKVSLRNVDFVIGGFKIPEEKNFVDYPDSEIDPVTTNFMKKIGEDIYYEHILPNDQKVFVNGWVNQENTEKIISEHEHTPLIISVKTKAGYLEEFTDRDSFFYKSNVFFLIGLTAIFFGLINFFNLSLVIIVIPIGITLAKTIYEIYNRMVELKKRCENALSQIDIELKKRSELIPLLEQIVKGHIAYEKTILQIIALIRTTSTNQEQKQSAFNDSKKEIKTIIGLVEASPELKTNKLFVDFIKRITIIEYNLAHFREFYNKTALRYNTLIIQFPFTLISKTLKFKQKGFIGGEKQI